MWNVVKKIVGTKNDRELKRIRPLVERVNELEASFEALSPEALAEKTPELRSRLDEGEALDGLLPEAFAAVRESSRRTTGMRHFDVQLIGGAVLHQGKIAEMKTGEGKTLVATLALYVNALEGKGAHLITVNDYLARRDVQWMGPIFHALGMSTASIIHDASFVYDPGHIVKDYRFQGLRPVTRKEAYLADITYGTNNEFGFDYLRDNMKFDLDDYVQRELHFAIVDEVDNILIDEARTPLIISGPSEQATDKYYSVDRILPKLRRDADYTVDEKLRQVYLTDEGVAKVERLLSIANLYDPTEIENLHHVTQALKAHALFKKDVDYVVKDGQVVIVDEFTGRLMPGRRWSDGLHQAVEAKEGVKIERENQTLATITIQNYFRMYSKLAGMTGTADTEAVEFKKIYELEVAVIPTNRDAIRVDHGDEVYRTDREKYDAVSEDIRECQERGQPCLVGTVSVEKSEGLSKRLKKLGIRHNVLNAVNHELEASVIAQAGRRGSVTIATNMAGRGTDILLGGNPEFLARAEMENTWIQRVGKLVGKDGERSGKRYEEELNELRERYEEEREKVRAEYEPRLKDVDERRKESLREETTVRERLLEASPLRGIRARYEGVASEDLVPAIADMRAIPERYFSIKEEMERALLDAVEGSEIDRGAARFETPRVAFDEKLEAWRDRAKRVSSLASEIDSVRNAYDRMRGDLELEVLVGGGAGASLAEELHRAEESSRALEEEYRSLEEPFQEALAQALDRFEKERQRYAQALDEVREEMEKAPQEFAEEFGEIQARYEATCESERAEVVEAGGLHVIGTERHESRRIDNQLRGRAGRQGDPGSSRFFLSLEDNLLRIFGGDRIQGFMETLGMEEGVPIEHKWLTKAIGNAQSKVEGHNFDVRKHLLEYDDVMNKQREVVYHRRRGILSGEGLRDEILEMANGLSEDLIVGMADPDTPSDEWEWKTIEEMLSSQFAIHLDFDEEQRLAISTSELVDHVREAFGALYDAKDRDFGEAAEAMSRIVNESANVDPRILRYFDLRLVEKDGMLDSLDRLWKDHLLQMDHLRQATGLRGYGQKNPLHEYQKEGYDLFEQMLGTFDEEVVRRIAHARPPKVEFQQTAMAAAGSERRSAASSSGVSIGREASSEPPGDAAAVVRRLEERRRSDQARREASARSAKQPLKTETQRRDAAKVGRNDPCPCGSGKKYKKCCGR